MTTREHLREMIDTLPDSVLPKAEQLLGTLQAEHDRVWQMFQDAPEDNEPLTEENVAAIEAGNADIAAGRTSSLADVQARLRAAG